VELGDRVVVIGGGNVALDVARTALREPAGTEAAAFDAARMAVRLGARDVTVVSLEARHEMPAYGLEIEEAEEEGVRLLHRLGPSRIVGDGHVEGLETVKVSSVFDADGRFNPQFIEGTEALIPCDSVILAIGQAPDLSWLTPDSGVEVSPRGTIAVDRETLATTARGVYAGGDVAFGPRNLIDAVSDGRRAAASIHRLLLGEHGSTATPEPASRVRRLLPVTVVNRPLLNYDAVARVPVPSEPSKRRIGLPEVELGYTEAQARTEAARCLQCFLNIELDVDLCILCGGCVDICPEDCIRIVPAEDLQGVAAGPGPASALVIQEDFCIRCALCVDRCPSDALSMASWSEASTSMRELEPA
jgi:formate dehydrogenase (NADP+) beta subunit